MNPRPRTHGAKPKTDNATLASDPKYAAKLKEMETLLLSEMKLGRPISVLGPASDEQNSIMTKACQS